MLEILKFVFSDFWIFIGFLILFGIAAWALSTFRLFTYVKEEHNETYNNEGVNTPDDMSDYTRDLLEKTQDRLHKGINKFDHVIIVSEFEKIAENIEKIGEPNENTLYIVKNLHGEPDHIGTLTFDEETGQFLVQSEIELDQIY